MREPDTRTADASTPFLYEQVEARIASLIDARTLNPGDRVPSLRRMADSAGVSLATVMQAYLALERKGWIESRPRSGFYVRRRPSPEPRLPRVRQPSEQPRTVRRTDLIESVFSAVHSPDILSLGVANPSPELLPSRALTRALTRTANQERVSGMSYSFGPGTIELRRQIAYRCADLGVTVAPEGVVVTAGATEALTLALQSVAGPGDVIAVESPAYFLILRLIEQLGMLALEIRTDPGTGLSLDSLEEALTREQVKAVVTVANFHNPLGSLMPEESKRALVEMARRHDVAVIEDDLYGDLSYGDRRPSPIKRYDPDHRVITCSSFSKTLAPGYRVGWILPGRHAEQVTQCKQTLTGPSATLPQLAVAEFLRTGNYDRHLRRIRRVYREQMERTRQAIAEHFPQGTRVSRPQGGFSLWVELPPGIDCEGLFRACLAHRVSVTPGVLFSPGRRYRHHVRICCGRPWTDSVERAIGTVGRLAREMAGS